MQRSTFLLAAFLVLAIGSLASGESRRTISLNGVWEVAEGSAGRVPERFEHQCPVPGLLDMASPAFPGVGTKSDLRAAFWYRRTFTIDGPLPVIAQLKVHKASFGTRVYLNGQPAGDHMPCFTPGLFDVRPALHGDGQSNELVIRVGASPENLPPGVPTGFDFEKKLYTPGIYDSVELILTGTHLGNPVPNAGRNPMIINEYGWLWLNRDGTPTALTKAVYDGQPGAEATPAQRRHLYARWLAAKTEYWRATRRFAGVLHFCGLSYSRPDGQTSDNFADLDALTFEPEFYKYVRDAFAPVGVMIDLWAGELVGSNELYDIRVFVTNDLGEPFSGELTLTFTGPRYEYRKTKACELDPFGQDQRWFPTKIPATPGKYQLLAELTAPGPGAGALLAGH